MDVVYIAMSANKILKVFKDGESAEKFLKDKEFDNYSEEENEKHYKHNKVKELYATVYKQEVLKGW